MALTDIVIFLERIAGHCSNIAKEEIEEETDCYAMHQYARLMKENNEYYGEQLLIYLNKYALAWE